MDEIFWFLSFTGDAQQNNDLDHQKAGLTSTLHFSF